VAIFEIVEPGGAVKDVLGLWRGVPAPISFDASPTGNAEPWRWRANLPQDVRQAAIELQQAQGHVRSWQAQLLTADLRLATFVHQTRTTLVPEYSFTPLDTPERELSAMLQELSQTGPDVSFGLTDWLDERWQQAIGQCQDLFSQAAQLVANYAVVETRSAGRLVGRTTVGWTGDVATSFPLGLTSEYATLHQATLTLALTSRLTLLQTSATVLRAAATLAHIATLAAVPGGALLALPAAWKFFQEVLNVAQQQATGQAES